MWNNGESRACYSTPKGYLLHLKGYFNKTRIHFSSILQCTGNINKNSYPQYCTDLRIFIVYAVKENEKFINL